MKKLLKWVVIALGACVMLGVIASIANNGKGGTATATPAARAQATAGTANLRSGPGITQ